MPRIPTSSAREGDGDKRHGHTFAAVEAIGGALPDVEVTTAWGQPALKVHGKMFVCIASHKSAEPNSLVVMMAFADRDAFVEDDPATHYLKRSLPELPVCARETDPHSSRRSSGPRGRRTPLRQRPDAEQVGRRQAPRDGSAITRSPLIDHEPLDRQGGDSRRQCRDGRDSSTPRTPESRSQGRAKLQRPARSRPADSRVDGVPRSIDLGRVPCLLVRRVLALSLAVRRRSRVPRRGPLVVPPVTLGPGHVLVGHP